MTVVPDTRLKSPKGCWGTTDPGIQFSIKAVVFCQGWAEINKFLNNRQHCAVDGYVRGSRNVLSHHHCLTEAYGESELCAGNGKRITHLLNSLFSVSHEGSMVCVEQLAHKDALHPGSGWRSCHHTWCAAEPHPDPEMPVAAQLRNRCQTRWERGHTPALLHSRHQTRLSGHHWTVRLPAPHHGSHGVLPKGLPDNRVATERGRDQSDSHNRKP